MDKVELVFSPQILSFYVFLFCCSGKALLDDKASTDTNNTMIEDVVANTNDLQAISNIFECLVVIRVGKIRDFYKIIQPSQKKCFMFLVAKLLYKY